MVDLMCDDYAKAAANRERIKNRSHRLWWAWYEAMLRTYPRGKPLPEWMHGNIPQLGNVKTRDLHQAGFHIDERGEE